MLGTSSAAGRSAARSSRLAAARDYATEVVQHAELQSNLALEDKILGNLSGIVMEAIDCLRSDLPFRSSSLSMLSLELLSYLRQPNKPMVVNFACAFTMLMSELEGIDLSERGGGGAEGGQRSYSNSIPDVPPDATTSTAAERVASASFSSPSTSRQSRPPPPAALPPHPLAQDSMKGLLKEEDMFGAEEQSRPSVEPIELDDSNLSGKAGRYSMSGEELMDDGRSESSLLDDPSAQNDLLQRMIANFSVPSTSTHDPSMRSDAARNQLKSKIGRFESRDDELACIHGLPVSATEIETMHDKDMALLLRSDQLSEQQKTIMRQIRKRARSKISSREYRRRKEAKRLVQTMNTFPHEPASG
ncbi:hypothetical protein PENTCL1PPCAC_4795 [Pristionchus entomophagus]|uniref:BZIP domain-containing protein n=1 Tax=Pristionchus entomophagus TaxID=358040 RepID=A0AAV5SRB8_9BILA|nr:hypothetical protein PENTCL1PPCAC_4795 [Pristionchus entomophagus]